MHVLRSRSVTTAVRVLLVAALIAALAGTTAFAAAQIGSKAIKDNSIRTQDVRNGTILKKDLRKSVRALLQRRGARGPAGPAGAGPRVTGPAQHGWSRL
jgi:hypothetical protein